MGVFHSTPFLYFLLAHVLTDYPLQTNTIARWKKEKGLWGNFIHASVFLWASLALTMVWRVEPVYLWTVVRAILFVTIIHGFLDYWKVSYTKKNPALDNIWTFLGDQALHLVSILLAIWIFRLPPTAIQTAPRSILVLMGALVSAFGATVVLFYIRNMIDRSHRYEMFSPYRRYFQALFAVAYYLLFLVANRTHLIGFPYLLLLNLAFNRLSLRHFGGEGDALFDTFGGVAFVALVALITRHLT